MRNEGREAFEGKSSCSCGGKLLANPSKGGEISLGGGIIGVVGGIFGEGGFVGIYYFC